MVGFALMSKRIANISGCFLPPPFFLILVLTVLINVIGVVLSFQIPQANLSAGLNFAFGASLPFATLLKGLN